MSNSFYLSRSRNFAAALLLAVVAWNVGTLIWMVSRYWIPVPVADQWDDAYFPQGILPRLFTLHNEHRPTLARLVGMIDWNLGGGRNVINVAFILLSMLLFALGLLGLVRATGEKDGRGLMIGAMALGVIASTEQWENLQWGFQTAFVGSFAGAILALLAAVGAVQAKGRPIATALALAGCLVASFAASFSLASGLLVFPVVLCVLVLGRASWKATAVYALCAAAVYLLYFHGYQREQDYSPLAAIRHPRLLALYIFAYIGSPFGMGDVGQAAIIGALGLVLLGWLLLDAAFKAEDLRTARPSLATVASLALLLYALMIVGAAGMAGLGRVRYGLPQALASRYGIAALTFWADIMTLLLLNVRLRNDRLARYVSGLGWLLGLGLVSVVAATQLSNVANASYTKERGISGAIVYMMGARHSDVIHGLYPFSEAIVSDDFNKRFQLMVQGRKSIFAEDWPYRLGKPIGDWIGTPSPNCQGYVDVHDMMPDEKRPIAHVSGWVWDSARQHVPDTVALTDDSGVVIGLAKTGIPRKDVANAMKDPSAFLAGWEGAAYLDPSKAAHAYGVDTQAPAKGCEFMILRPGSAGFVNDPPPKR
jgi:hypothetical protein